MTRPDAVDLTIYLIKEGRDGSTCLSSAAGLRQFPLSFPGGLRGTLVVKPPRPNVPKWARFFTGQMNPREFGKGSSPAAALLLGVGDRWFAITFGPAGRFIVDQDAIEERFGLITVLNTIPEDRLRSLDKTAFDARGTHSRVQTSREATPTEFGLDVENDLVMAVTGRPSDADASLGVRMTGMDALRATVHLELQELPRQLSRYLRKYQSSAYKAAFPWVDHIAAVHDGQMIEVLDEYLVAAIREEDTDTCWLAVPGVVDWATYNRFRYGAHRRNALHHDLDLATWLCEREAVSKGRRARGDVSVGQLKQARVVCVDENANERQGWSIYKCLSAEVTRGDKSYVLSGGQWYRIDNDIVAQVDRFYADLGRYENALPEYDDDSERDYNVRVSRESEGRLALLDADLIAFGGTRQKVEVCDLYSDARDFIHVKRYSQSSALSHLFSQGTVAGELFRSQSTFRELVNSKLPSTHRVPNCEVAPGTNEYRVVFAVISSEPGPALHLPFFSRLNLRSATRRLQAYGFRVAVAKIPVNAERAVTRTYLGTPEVRDRVMARRTARGGRQ